MKRITNWLLTIFFGTSLGFLAERFIFGRKAQEKIMSLKAELNAMRGQLRESERKVSGQSAEILTLQSKLNNHTHQLSIVQQEASQLRDELSSARAISEVTDLEPAGGVETDEAYVSDDLEVQSAESEGMVVLPPDEFLPTESLPEEAPPAEEGGVETDEAYVSDDLEVQSAESEGMVILPPDAESATIHDLLQKIEGIGPKSEAALLAAGVTTFMQVADMTEDELTTIITGAGMRRPGSISTWAEQALLAAAEDWDALTSLQDALRGGRRTN